MPEIGERWGYREKPRTAGGALREVEVLQLGPSRSTKVRVRWQDGEYSGMDEWISGVRLVVPWHDAAAFVRDEELAIALVAAQPGPLDAVTVREVLQVWFATKAPLTFEVEQGEPILARVWPLEERAGLSFEFHESEAIATPAAYVDRDGDVHIGQNAALELVRRLCAEQADLVLEYQTKELDRLRAVVTTGWYTPSATSGGEPWRMEAAKARQLLEDAEMVWELLCDWCGQGGHDAFDEREALRAEVLRLQGLVEDAARFLKSTDHPVKAAALRREMVREASAD